MTKIPKKPITWGVVGTVILMAAFLILLTLLNSFDHALDEFFRLWYWMIPLSAGFGLQIGLFSHVRQMHKSATVAGVAASGSVSASSMAACCAHHVSDVLPFIGIAGITFFINKYQTVFLMTGFFSSIMGTLMMLRITSRIPHSQLGQKIKNFNFNLALKTSAAVSVAAVLLMIGVIGWR